MRIFERILTRFVSERRSWRFSLVPALLATLALSTAGPAAAAAKKLPALAADPAKVSISGLSAGGFMAVQYDVAFSASTVGVGVVAGGPYNCAYVNFGGISTCMSGSPIGAASYGAAQGFAFIGQVDAVDHIKSQKIYLFSGADDTVVKPSVMNAVWDFYRAAQVPEASIQYVKQFPAGHAFISDDFGADCAITAAPYVNQCPAAGGLYDQPNAILTQIYGPLQPKAAVLTSIPVAFKQTPFASAFSGLSKTGYVYVPADCRKTAAGPKCAVHVVFHGCDQNATTVGDAVYGRLGYNEWADSNRIIVLYPQVDANALSNAHGCWDWWGYSGLNFQTRSGPQLSAVRAMVEHLTGS